MATTPIHVARPHEFLKRLPTALVVSVGLLAVAAVPSTAGASLSPKKHSQPATPIASITPSLRQYSDTQIIVSFKGGMPREAMQNAERGIGALELSSLHVGSAYLLAVQSGHVLDSIRALKSHPAVRYAEPDYLLQLAATPNDPSFPIQWAYRNTGQIVNGTSGIPNADEKATPAWSLTPKNAVVIAETDTGVDYTHPDLAGAIWTNPGGISGCAAGTHGYNVRNSTCDPMDDDTAYGGHGTHVAGILGAVGNNGIGVPEYPSPTSATTIR